MSDIVIRQEPALTRAADEFIADKEKSPYGFVNGVEVYVSRDLREAFERGVAWEQGYERPDGPGEAAKGVDDAFEF